MSLQVWLPLNGNLNNQGLSEVTVTNNGATIDSKGKIGSCYSFDTGKYLTVTRPATITREISYSCWVNISSWNDAAWYDTILSICTGTNWVDCRATLCRNGIGKNLIWNIANGSSRSHVTSNTSLSLNTWYHIACTYDGIKLRIYINGVEDNSADASIAPNYSSTKLYIGSSKDNAYNLKGRLNDVRIYNRCLSAKEVKEISKGLILHYKLSDPYIENTTNLYSGWSSNCYNGATGSYQYGADTDMYYDTSDNIIKVRMGTSDLDAWPYVFFNNITPPSNGEYRTLSFDYYPTIKDWINFYSYGTSGTITWVSNGVKGTGGYIPVNTNSWNHISVTIKNTGSSSSGFGYMSIGLEKHTSSTSNYWLFKNIQIESKDHSTGYINAGTSRSESLCFDSSGFGNNGVVKNQSSIFIERDSPRYAASTVFNGAPFIIGQNLDGAKSTDALSLCAWINPSQVSGVQQIVVSYEGGGAGLHISGGNIYCQIYSSGYAQVSGGSISANTWYHVVGTYDNSKLRIYVNGELKGEVAKTGNITYNSSTPWAVAVNPCGATGDDEEYFYGKLSDVRIYSTALSASDIKELYNTSASVDKNGNMYAYEFKEE